MASDVVEQVADAVEALDPDEALFVTLTVELSPDERVALLDEVQAVVDELRRRGRTPRVAVRRAAGAGELHAICVD